MKPSPSNGNGRHVAVESVTPVAVEAQEQERPKSWLANVSSSWKALTLIAAIAGGGYLAGSKLATAESVKKASSRIDGTDRRDDRQDVVLKALVDSARWQNQALWDVSRGEQIQTPPPALPGVE